MGGGFVKTFEANGAEYGGGGKVDSAHVRGVPPLKVSGGDNGDGGGVTHRPDGSVPCHVAHRAVIKPVAYPEQQLRAPRRRRRVRRAGACGRRSGRRLRPARIE